MGVYLTKEEFLKRAAVKHGDLYDYSLVHYVSAHHKIDVVCKEHGVFSQTAASHLTGKGCPSCATEKSANKRRIGTEKFIEVAKKIHGDKFQYHLVDYKNKDTKIKIICPVHGEFEVRPASHLKGYDCRKCAADLRASTQKLTKEEFVLKSYEVHGEFYNYDKVVYNRNSDKVTITCKIHGDFEQTPAAHLVGKGCSKCANIERGLTGRLTTQEFIQNSKEVHGDKYDYSRVEYNLAKDLVEIICPEHGPFWKIADKHTQGQGCPSCANRGFNNDLPGYLYVLECDNICKVGITNRTPDDRASEVSRSRGCKFSVKHSFFLASGYSASTTETIVLRWLNLNYKSVEGSFDGSTECFMDVDYEDLLNKIKTTINEVTSATRFTKPGIPA